MKNTLLFITLLFTIVGITSCENKNPDIPEITGKWDYVNAHLVFDYAEDTIRLAMGPQTQKFAVKDLQAMLPYLAHQMLGEYLKELVFTPSNYMDILITMGERGTFAVNATYRQSENYLQVELDSTQLKALTQGSVSQIPAISFNYAKENDHLSLYLDRDYLRLAYAMMGDALVDLLISNVMHQDPDHFPATAKAAIRKQLDGIVSKITELEIGVNLIKRNDTVQPD